MSSPLRYLLLRIRSSSGRLLCRVRWDQGRHRSDQPTFGSLSRSSLLSPSSFGFYYLFIYLNTIYLYNKVCYTGFYTLSHHMCETWSLAHIWEISGFVLKSDCDRQRGWQTWIIGAGVWTRITGARAWAHAVLPDRGGGWRWETRVARIRDLATPHGLSSIPRVNVAMDFGWVGLSWCQTSHFWTKI